MDISIIVPTHKRNELLKQCLDSILRQDYHQDRYEVIVVMDGKYDLAEEMLEKLTHRYRNLRYVMQETKGPAAARNLGASLAKGEILGFTDDDCVLCKDWIKNTVNAHRNNNVLAIGGLTVVNNYKVNAAVSQFLANGAIKCKMNGKEEVIFFPTCNISYKKHLLEKERFDELFPLPAGEDLEYFWRLFKKGHKFLYREEIRVLHSRQTSLRSFLRQAYMYGRGNYLVKHIHKDHPLLKEIKTGKFSFWAATLLNIMKIPRFSYLLGRKLIKENNIKTIYRKLSVYSYFAIHKIFYLLGNIAEFIKINRKRIIKVQNSFHIPQLLILDITHTCNLNCRICDIWKTGNTKKDIAVSYIKNVLLQARKLEIKEIVLSGGEPLLRPDVFDIFDYTRELDIKHLGVLTNGILIGEYIERLRPYILDNTISPVLSLDSLKPAIHNHLRNSNSAWQKTTTSLKALSLIKKEYPQINFNVITIIFDGNLEELLDISNFIKELGANSLQFQVLLPNNLRMAERTKSPFWVNKDRLPVLDGTIDKLAEFKNKNPQLIKNSIENLSLMKKYYRGTLTSDDVKCLSAYETILISNSGECTTCFCCYGDIKKQDLRNILGGEKIIKAQETVERCHYPCLLPCFCDRRL